MIQLDSVTYAGETAAEVVAPRLDAATESGQAVAPILTCGLDPQLNRFFASLFDGFGFTVTHAGSRDEALQSIAARPAPVVICAAALPGGGWRGLLRDLESLRERPALIVVGETSIWNEVLEAGGFDVLSTPWRQDEVIWTVTAAWHEWMNRTERLYGGVRCSDA